MNSKKILKSTVLVIMLLCCSVKVFATEVEYIPPFKLNPLNDGIILGTGALLSGSALVCDKILKMKISDFDESKLNKSDVPVFDQFFMQPYNKPLHIVATGTVAISLLSPLVFATLPGNEWLNIGMMYGETLLLANGIKEWLKIIVDRPRPYMYYSGYPQDKVDDGDWNCSFPSGHTTLAFASAAFTTFLFNMYYPDSNLRYAVAGISFGLATVTAGLRMASGNHFFSDVFVGAIIGTVCGFVVPYMHTETYYKNFQKNKGTSVSTSPLGFNVQVKF